MTDKTCKAYLIDTERCRIEQVEYVGLQGMQKFVGGYIETAFQWENGDTLYVDEEGLFKKGELVFFTLDRRRDQPFAGNGLLVGAEDDEGNTAPPKITIEELTAAIGFL
jgi:hypothetical protein